MYPELLVLSDDSLLTVLSYLPPRELIGCRLLCRRLRDLCLHRDLWKKAVVRGRGLVRAALALAPCVSALIVDSGLPLEVLASYVPSTTCVVAALHLGVGNQTEALFAALIVQKLSALGGLKMIALNIDHSFPPGDTLTPLLQAAYNIDGLKELQIDNNTEKALPAAWCERQVSPSMTKLLYLGPSAGPFLELLLRTHAATLQDVSLYLTEGTPVSFLEKIPGLRHLVCHPHEDLSRLSKLPELQTLDLAESPDDEPFVAGALELLRQASHLRTVTFCFTWVQPLAPLSALVESPSARLVENLELCSARWADLDVVAAALPQFPSLRTLSLDIVPSYDFLRAVSPTSAPSLTTLKVYPSRRLCLHAWLHDPANQDLLARNARLHLQPIFPQSVSTVTISDKCECQWCRWGCHSSLRGPISADTSFATHGKMSSCPTGCFQI
ncbi:uncharacterized protein LOC117649734 [Thrips palmi]|uniref:Uncharacterized protein LOC117649734 n=1 Tax=Thrips palmi TaxID=161013 RepID=A0A6P8ZTN9_THRPL|nr:uncharacterized protein LOC117649734 [Thrips palmi]XP_034248630.1 uncharacterized protein LOC117649734 [Thrips palmi]XP_034248631.1 uncharacterized protein LOC117649734 [Thrips palmi]XP_034248632.1 uncharacterized protein LOC117649734 [Thrips palmi]XP_034248634.1 uncharacterized protein LOC117649734 [Thrips palmi]XP_034248635.1 uncharacterized protein LOC117649734 [Thrips palmi]XP_034248636.1 uncharacterized protein LOC117649734 [Thrips palmi]XP_034248637.1 uncharacterized protein LOC1176